MRFVAPVLVFGLLLVVFYFGLQKDPGFVPSPLIGRPAPAFSMPRLDDPTATLTEANLRGQVSLLNVWATWCVGCRQEHQTLVDIARSGEVPIYGLNWKDDSAMARDWLARLGDPYAATGVDADGTVAIDWGVYGAPETFLIDADGTVLYKHIAPLTPEIWAREFLPRIQAARQSSP
jgi:cytochrome c biogenesis protein CcmG/thiol:disulfide interchange protein DsbE